MASPDAPSRPRGLRVLLAALAGLVLSFGGACGVGPTDLSLLAVSGPPTQVPDDGRGQVAVPVTVEVAQPARRRLLRRVATWRGGLRTLVRRVQGAWSEGVVARLGPPPLRGPPLVVA